MNRYQPVRTVTVRADYSFPIHTAVVTIADDTECDDHRVLLDNEGKVVGWEDYDTGAWYTNTLFHDGCDELLIVK